MELILLVLAYSAALKYTTYSSKFHFIVKLLYYESLSSHPLLLKSYSTLDATVNSGFLMASIILTAFRAAKWLFALIIRNKDYKKQKRLILSKLLPTVPCKIKNNIYDTVKLNETQECVGGG